MSATIISPALRRMIAADPDVGGGNALATAVRVSPDADAPYLFAQAPVRDARGRLRDELSLRELTDLVGAWSAWYAERGVGPRDRVGVYLRDSADDLVHYLALTRLGAIAVLVNGQVNPAVAVAHFNRTGALGVQADDEHLPWVAAAGAPQTRPFWVTSHTDAVLPAPDAAPPPFRHAPGDPALVCHTSGTTGVPKPVIWTHGQMMAGVRGHLTQFPSHPASVVLSALPPSHASAIGYAVLAMLTGVPLVAAADRSGAAVAAAADRYRATIVTGSRRPSPTWHCMAWTGPAWTRWSDGSAWATRRTTRTSPSWSAEAGTGPGVSLFPVRCSSTASAHQSWAGAACSAR
jgi:acyl-CoA synthetase (AMP-forming)/AMP-acid ligase II